MLDQVARFADALSRHDAELVETTTDGFTDELTTLVERPAVGTPLPAPLEYDSTPVESVPDLAAVESAETGVTPVSMGIAEYGSVVVPGTAAGEEPTSLFARHHVAVLPAADLVPDVPAALARIGAAVRAGHGDHVVATGPSATADMGELVIGAHGPERVTVMLVEGADSYAESEDSAPGRQTDADRARGDAR
jgi:L-lactate dehydrogenase complex protein LldG